MEDGSFVKNFPLDMGSITAYSGRRKDTEIFYSFMSFLTPGIIYHCDMSAEELKPSVSVCDCILQSVTYWYVVSRAYENGCVVNGMCAMAVD